MSPLKLIFLITVPFNCKMTQFLLIGFHSVTIFYQMVPFFQVWSIKQILALFLFSASAYYRDNWINNAAIWMSECGLYVLCVCVCVCVKSPLFI